MLRADMEGEEAQMQNVSGSRRHNFENLDADFRTTRDDLKEMNF